MLETRNKTPFAVALAPALDKFGVDHVVLALKATYSLPASRSDAQPTDDQIPVAMADESYGEPGISSVKFEMETCLRKPGTDIVLLGHAYAPRPKSTTVDVTVTVAKISKTIRVTGDRRWMRMAGFTRSSEPLSFDRIPLVYERAFGGRDDGGGPTALEPRNPVGTGYMHPSGLDRIDGVALPNLEDPAAPVRRPEDRPAPAGFGYIGRHWTPRSGFAGTYDAAWESERAPFLPDDFDDRFFNGASAGLVATPHLRGGEDVRIANASPRGEVVFRLPTQAFQVDVWIKGKHTTHSMTFDTLILEPDDDRFSQVWRATVPCPGEFLMIDRVRFRHA